MSDLRKNKEARDIAKRLFLEWQIAESSKYIKSGESSPVYIRTETGRYAGATHITRFYKLNVDGTCEYCDITRQQYRKGVYSLNCPHFMFPSNEKEFIEAKNKIVS